MGAIGWIWAWLLLLGAVRAHMTRTLPVEIAGAMALSGLLLLPLLWNRSDGLFRLVAPSAMVRAAIAMFVLLAAGLTRPDAVLGLLPA